MRLDEVILRDDRASQPAANSVPAGTLYFVTDEDVIERSDGTNWQAYSGTGDAIVGPGTTVDKEIMLFDGTTGLAVERATGTGIVRVSSGVYGTPGAVDLTTEVTGTLPVANGGTGVTDLAALRVATVVLTDAQIKALPTTPIQLVAAPGAGFRILPVILSARANTTAGAYTNVNATYSAIQYRYAGESLWLMTPIVNDTGITYLNTFLTGTAHIIQTSTNYADGYDAAGAAGTPEYTLNQPVSIADAENLAFHISMDNNGSGDLTGGNAANTLTIKTYYIIEAVS